MLTPFSPLIPSGPVASYDALARAAKDLRNDPGAYAGDIDFERAETTLWRWEMVGPAGLHVVGLLGLYPLADLVPHESTTAAALTRPRHPIQIRPVMALTDDHLPAMEATAAPREFHGSTTHIVTPVEVQDAPAGSAVIADGHHRTAAALRVGGDPRIMTLMVSTRESTLVAGAFHRAFAHPVAVPRAVEGAHVEEIDPDDALAGARICLVSGERAIAIVPDGPGADRYAGIPAGWVHDSLLPQLGLDEGDAIYLDDAATAAAAAQYGTALVLPGSDVRAVVTAAMKGLPLPPKATRFRPKPLRGFVMRVL